MDASHLRKAALAAAAAFAGVTAAVGGVAFLFWQEGLAARNHVGHQLGDRGPDADTVYRPEWGNPLRLVVAGDSVADSLGASQPSGTLGAQLALALAVHAHRSVELRTIAEVGARTHDVPGQIENLPDGWSPDVAVMIVGGNDLTGWVPMAESIELLEQVIAQFQRLGSSVVLGTCPDFDTLPSLPLPLRELGGQLSRRLASAQFKAATAAGSHPVLLGKAVRQVFLSDPRGMFAIDGFHPSDKGYESAARALVPALLVAYDGGRPTRRDHAATASPAV